MRKKCCKCKIEKLLSEFNKNKTKKDGLNTICKVCSRERSKQYYKDNLLKHRKVTQRRRKKHLKKIREYVWNWLSTHPCVDCAETDIVILEFDHRGHKDASISQAVNQCWSIEKIKEEIKKCDVRCCNCHRRKTARQFGWKVLEYEYIAPKIVQGV